MATSKKRSKIEATYLAANKIAKPDEIFQTRIPFLRLIHSTTATPMRHGILKPSFCLILKGKKQMVIGDEVIDYGPGDFLISTIEMPTSGRIAGATKTAPYLGLSLEIDPREITAILSEVDDESETKLPTEKAETPSPGAFVSKSDAAIRDACYRLVKLLAQPRPSKFLATNIKREILFHLLTGPEGAKFYQNVVSRRSEIGIDRAIRWIKGHLDQPLKVAELAKMAGMSVSGLHHKFKAITTKGPLQYQKQLRLFEARQLLLTGAVDVARAADKVGYVSQSQFTREYRRLFGQAPTKDLKQLRQAGRDVLHD